MSLELFWVLMFIMEKTKSFILITQALAFLALLPKMESQIRPLIPTTPRPLCASQFALANYACARLPYTPGSPPSPPTPSSPPPSPPSPPDDDDDDVNGHGHHHRHGHEHSHGHGHRHGHHHRHRLTPQEDNCCRWIKEVDSQCVCEILIRLPPFLVRPLHHYTVKVGELCDVTYSCGGPL